MRQRPPDEFTRWVREEVAPIARAARLAGPGPVFRRREGANWIVFALERRRVDPHEAIARGDDPLVDFRMVVGAHVPAARPAWDTRAARPPGIHDVRLRSPSAALEPTGGSWHVFDPRDRAGQDALLGLIRHGLPAALASLGPADTRSILDRRLAFAGPLENLAPGAAEELLALADEAGAPDVRAAIAEALRRGRVADPTRRAWPVRGRIDPAWPVGRRVARTRERLLADLSATKVPASRIAASRLSGWTDEPRIVEALRAALGHRDAFTRLVAASSLGHLGDGDPATWRRTLALGDDAAAGPRQLGEAIVLLARLDLKGRRDMAIRALHELADRYPAWTRELLAFAAALGGTA